MADENNMTIGEFAREVGVEPMAVYDYVRQNTGQYGKLQDHVRYAGRENGLECTDAVIDEEAQRFLYEKFGGCFRYKTQAERIRALEKDRMDAWRQMEMMRLEISSLKRELGILRRMIGGPAAKGMNYDYYASA